MLLYIEYLLLFFLYMQDGVVYYYGFFQDCICEIVEDIEFSWMVKKMKKCICFVLDCFCVYDFSDKIVDFINLQYYVIKEKRFSEWEIVVIFYDVVCVVEVLYQKNIVYRDLKLGNMVFNKRIYWIIIINFCFGKYLVSEGDFLKDQRGSFVYISFDVFSGWLYCGKFSDMWVLGVVFFIMLYGQFFFYDSILQEFFCKIKVVEYIIFEDGWVFENIVCFIWKLLVFDFQQCLVVVDVLEVFSVIIVLWQFLLFLSGFL